jgi:hypothetical protein
MGVDHVKFKMEFEKELDADMKAVVSGAISSNKEAVIVLLLQIVKLLKKIEANTKK